MSTATWTHVPELAGKLTASNFQQNLVMITFEDWSFAQTYNVIVREEGEFIVVYTEHCGYWVFPRHSVAKWEVFGAFPIEEGGTNA